MSSQEDDSGSAHAANHPNSLDTVDGNSQGSLGGDGGATPEAALSDSMVLDASSRRAHRRKGGGGSGAILDAMDSETHNGLLGNGVGVSIVGGSSGEEGPTRLTPTKRKPVRTMTAALV